MMAILIIILDVGITRNIPPERRAEIHARLAEWWPFGGSSRSGGSAVAAFRCDGREYGPYQATFSPQTLVFDGGRSNTTVKVGYGIVRVDGHGGYIIQDPTGIVENHIHSYDWEAKTITALSPAEYKKQCTPK